MYEKVKRSVFGGGQKGLNLGFVASYGSLINSQSLVFFISKIRIMTPTSLADRD